MVIKVLNLLFLSISCLLIYSCSGDNTNIQSSDEKDSLENYSDSLKHILDSLERRNDSLNQLPDPLNLLLSRYPDFITKTEDYFINYYLKVPEIDLDTFVFRIDGLADSTLEFSYDDLMTLPYVEQLVTIECIGNWPTGSFSTLISTALWKGFNIYEFLKSLGMEDTIGGIKYTAADGYFASHTLDQLKNNNVIGALFINGDTLTDTLGFPLRIINPGFYGVKQPAWVTSLEILHTNEIASDSNDYWALQNWDVSPPMAVDCKIFFPGDTSVKAGNEFTMGGAGHGGKRITKVEISLDSGLTWQETDLIESSNLDYVWVFWYYSLNIQEPGNYKIYARATDIYGNIQPFNDPTGKDGNSQPPSISIQIF